MSHASSKILRKMRPGRSFNQKCNHMMKKNCGSDDRNFTAFIGEQHQGPAHINKTVIHAWCVNGTLAALLLGALTKARAGDFQLLAKSMHSHIKSLLCRSLMLEISARMQTMSSTHLLAIPCSSSFSFSRRCNRSCTAATLASVTGAERAPVSESAPWAPASSPSASRSDRCAESSAQIAVVASSTCSSREWQHSSNRESWS
mmetsp:Transcript_9308/g.21626  ORF Transcript_9308/g.21626 Transcript_9308/m.21626 type:complete len:202 (+) Transcript_9308:205-810(+)